MVSWLTASTPQEDRFAGLAGPRPPANGEMPTQPSAKRQTSDHHDPAKRLTTSSSAQTWQAGGLSEERACCNHPEQPTNHATNVKQVEPDPANVAIRL